MKKEYFVILLLLLVFFIYSKKAKAEPQGGISVPETKGTPKRWDFKYYRVKAGDTLYKICRNNLNLDKIPDYLKAVQESFPTITTEKQFILLYCQYVAETNGFDWNLYDDKFSNNAKDPDTLLVKQKITLFSPDSYEVINSDGPLFGGVQYVAGWDLLPVSIWGNSIRLDNANDLVSSFQNNPPQNI